MTYGDCGQHGLGPPTCQSLVRRERRQLLESSRKIAPRECPEIFRKIPPDNRPHHEQAPPMATVPQFPPIRSQVPEHLRRELAHGRWSGVMPGSNRLARESGVSALTASR